MESSSPSAHTSPSGFLGQERLGLLKRVALLAVTIAALVALQAGHGHVMWVNLLESAAAIVALLLMVNLGIRWFDYRAQSQTHRRELEREWETWRRERAE